MSDEEKDTAISGADNERLKLQAELLQAERKQTISEESIEHALGFMGSIHKHWHTASLELKRAYQELIFPDGFTYDIRGKKFITPAVSPLYRVELGETRAMNAKDFVMVTLGHSIYKLIVPEIMRWNRELT